MIIHRGFKFKLYPTDEQAEAFRKFSGVCRLIYNIALEQRRDFYRQYQRNTGKHLSYFAQSAELKYLRAEFDWIAAVPHCCEQGALHDLDKSFVNFFAGRARYPAPRQKGTNDSFRFEPRKVRIERMNSKWSRVRLLKIGWVKFRDTRPIRGRLLSATISHDVHGWYISFACEIEQGILANDLPSVGIDRGIANTLALSTGEMLRMSSLAALDKCKRRAQRIMSRKKRGSNRRKKALARVSRLSAKIARNRRDWHHKASLSIARRFGDVVIEDLNIANMTASAKGTLAEPGRAIRQKATLNRAILNQGWFQFETMLAYKLKERGGTLSKVDPRYTSQTCSACGCIDGRSRESQARFVCVHCGHEAHADTNAAIEILRRSTSLLRMEGGQSKSPDEVRTGKRRKSLENPRHKRRGRC